MPAGWFVLGWLIGQLGGSCIAHYRLWNRLGWELDLSVDPPAFIRKEVRNAVWRWRWRRIEAKHPALVQLDGGFGAHMGPIFRLLNDKCRISGWKGEHKGALRSAVLNRQWPQDDIDTDLSPPGKHAWRLSFF